MTSSQALTFNLFAMLDDGSSWFIDSVGRWLGRTDLQDVTAYFEFAPERRSEHLNDQTRIDVLLVLRTASGHEVIATEIKYADRFNSRHVRISTEPYRRLNAAMELWPNFESVVESRETNQLARVHALAMSHGRTINASPASTLFVIAHEDDALAPRIASRYAQVAPTCTVRFLSLQSALRACSDAARSPGQRASARALVLRYADQTASHDAWSFLEAARRDRIDRAR